MNELLLSGRNWRLSGWIPFQWKLCRACETGDTLQAEIGELPVPAPGSVADALRRAGIIPDWNYGDNARQCEWVENRHWMLETDFTVFSGRPLEVRCDGLDDSGWLLLDGTVMAEFSGAFRPHRFPLGTLEPGSQHRLAIVFDCPPRRIGQFGYAGTIRPTKPRFNYIWDWMPRIVQIGITGAVTLREVGAPELALRSFDTTVDGLTLALKSELLPPGTEVEATLLDGAVTIAATTFPAAGTLSWGPLPVAPWYPNREGEAKRYTLRLAAAGTAPLVRTIGFRRLRRKPNPGAPAGAAPWLFEINGREIFVQGINWTPLRSDPAGADRADYQRRIAIYQDMGVNLFRVWGGAGCEQECFYELCDAAGIMVWQEFPLCGAGLDSLPPSDLASLDELDRIVDAYIDRLNSHPSVVLWCGGNELSHGDGRPCDGNEAALQVLAAKVAARDPGRGFVPTSASGPREFAAQEEFGQGLHHDVHGPWKPEHSDLQREWHDYWEHDDALFRSECGSPGASAPELLRRYAGELDPEPVARSNRFWLRPMDWWFEIEVFAAQHGRPPAAPEEYADWSRRRQAEALTIAVSAIKRRFPRAGGVILWMGHDSFPCPCNTSLIDFEGNPKPAVAALKKIFQSAPEEL